MAEYYCDICYSAMRTYESEGQGQLYQVVNLRLVWLCTPYSLRHQAIAPERISQISTVILGICRASYET